MWMLAPSDAYAAIIASELSRYFVVLNKYYLTGPVVFNAVSSLRPVVHGKNVVSFCPKILSEHELGVALQVTA
jgi:hypothetical protein